MSKKSAEAIKAWRNRIGKEKAQAITTKASRRGTAAHKLIEEYVLGEPRSESMPNEIDLFKRLQSVADEYIDNIRSVEGQMASTYLRVAGTVDLVADFDGKISIIDWKTSLRPKKKEYCEGYFMQASAYAVMFEENTGIPVSRLVVIIANEESNIPQVFIEKRDDWINKFIELREEYDVDHGVAINQ